MELFNAREGVMRMEKTVQAASFFICCDAEKRHLENVAGAAKVQSTRYVLYSCTSYHGGFEAQHLLNHPLGRASNNMHSRSMNSHIESSCMPGCKVIKMLHQLSAPAQADLLS